MKPSLVVILILIAVGIFYVSTFRAGHLWGDDFALYIQHAKNLAEGRAYDQTGYIYNPHKPDMGPPEYPPMFPLVLAVVYKVAGMNLVAMKAVNTVLFLAALYVFYLAFAADLPFVYLVVSILVLALNPYLWDFKDGVQSDMLFLLLSYTGLCLFAAVQEKRAESPLRIGAVAVCIYLAYATRTAAVVLLPSLLAADLVQLRRVRSTTTATAGLATALILAHSIAFRGTVRYADQLHFSFPALLQNAQAYVWQIEKRLWFNDINPHLSLLLFLTAVLLGMAGLVIRLFRCPKVFDVFAAGYVAMIFLWLSPPDLRLLIPVIPLWVLYAATALYALRQRAEPAAKWMAVTAISQVLIAYAYAYTAAPYGPIAEGIGDPDFRSMCHYIYQHTATSAVFVFSKPRLLALMTGRPAAAYHEPTDDSELWAYLRGISVQYIIYGSELGEDRRYLLGFLSRGHDQLRKTFANRGFVVYQIVSPIQTARSDLISQAK
jgi:hypothetical protein